MIDSITKKLEELIDKKLLLERTINGPRNYIGASQLGKDCSRSIQLEFMQERKNKDLEFKSLRIFETGNFYENIMRTWLKNIGFFMETNADKIGFSTLNGKIKGHPDGIIFKAPPELNFNFPMIWECKSANNKNWNNMKENGLSKANPAYATQISLYQAYLEEKFPGISKNPALFTAINKDNSNIYVELIQFDGELAQKASDKGVNIFKAIEHGELMPPIVQKDKIDDFWICKFCSYSEICKEKL